MCFINAYDSNLLSQNLVINPSLEGDSCDISDFNNNSSVDLPDWDQLFTADYYTLNNCRGKIKYRTPNSGKSCAGIFVNTISKYLGKRYVSREYLIGKLKEPLINNRQYSVSFNVKPSYTIDEVKKVYTTRNISLSFVNSKSDILKYRNINEEYLLDLPEDITNTSGEIFDYINYTKVDGCYIAKGGENYLVIGNFLHDSLSTLLPLSNESLPNYTTAYFLVDDVKVEELKELPEFEDHYICKGDTLNIDLSGQINNNIFLNNSKIKSNEILINKAGNYIIESELGKCRDFRKFNVFEKECESCHIYIPNIISANNDGINDVIEVKSNCEIEVISIAIYSRWGNCVLISTSSLISPTILSNLQKGTYVLECKVLLKHNNEVKYLFRDITIN